MGNTEREQGNGGDALASGRYVVFCADGEDYGQEGYIVFTHEADVMMIAAAGEVESGELTPAEARKLLEPYREVLPPLYTGEQRMVFDPDRFGWNDPESFPSADDVQQSPQASQIFWYEVDELGIEGVTLKWSVPFPILAPVSNKALKELKEAVSDEYEIAVKKHIEEFDAMGKSVEWARKLIEEATTTGIPQRLQACGEGQYDEDLADTTRFEGVDPEGQDLKDPTLTTGRYIDDDISNLQPGDKVRILYIEDESNEHLAPSLGTVVSVNGDSYLVDLGVATINLDRPAIELMPTNFNSHYGDKQDSESTASPGISSREREESRMQLVYGDGGEGLVFLEREYAVDIRDFRSALYKAAAWGELKTMVSEERYEETVDAWVQSQIDRLLSEGDLEDDEPEVPPPGSR